MLKGMVGPESREEMKEYLKSGYVFEAYVDDGWAGIIGAASNDKYGVNGFEVIDEIMARQFRGKALAPAMQRHLINQLPSSENAVIHGTIHPSNAPSLATAKRVERVELINYLLVSG
jgi:RimJ/RimL family protein N-acetyltransferase